VSTARTSAGVRPSAVNGEAATASAISGVIGFGAWNGAGGAMCSSRGA